MSEGNMDRILEPVSPVDSLLSNEVFRVKPVSRDSDRKQDDRFDEQMKKKKREQEKTDTVKTSGSADLSELDEETPIVRDEVLLSGMSENPGNPADKPKADDKSGKDGIPPDDSGHVNVIA